METDTDETTTTGRKILEESDRELTPALKEYGFRPKGTTGWAMRDSIAVRIDSNVVPGSAVHSVEVYAATDDGLVDPSRPLGRAEHRSHDQAVRKALEEADVEPKPGDGT